MTSDDRDAFGLPRSLDLGDVADSTAELHPALEPYQWLIGTWRGVGVVGYPTMDEAQFGQEIVFGHRGTPVLTYRARSWILGADGSVERPAATEAGFWRPQPDDALEVVLSHAFGITEVWVGSRDGTKIELVTDAIVRTGTAKEVTAGRRLYGFADFRLLWAFDMAAVGQPMQPHASARLDRVPADQL